MKSAISRIIALVLISSLILPIIAGCAKSERAMETPSGLSPRQQREQSKKTAGL